MKIGLNRSVLRFGEEFAYDLLYVLETISKYEPRSIKSIDDDIDLVEYLFTTSNQTTSEIKYISKVIVGVESKTQRALMIEAKILLVNEDMLDFIIYIGDGTFILYKEGKKVVEENIEDYPENAKKCVNCLKELLNNA